MPIEVKCLCGKVFKVKDELRGKIVQCQLCASLVPVPAPTALTEAPLSPDPPAPETAPAAEATPVRPTKECSACAETIPADATWCPICRATLGDTMSPEQQSELLRGLLASLDVAAHDYRQRAADAALLRNLPSAKSWVALGCLAVGLVMTVLGFALNDQAGWAVAGVPLMLVAAIATAVSLTNDHGARNIRSAGDPAVAFRRFVGALRTGRTEQAFAAIAPAARQTGATEPLSFEKIPHTAAAVAIRDLASFRAYWKSVLRGGGSNARSVKLKQVSVAESRGGQVVAVEALAEFTSYNSYVLLLLLINWIICLIVYVATRKVETKLVRKVLIRHDGQWYIANPELTGAIDRPILLRKEAAA